MERIGYEILREFDTTITITFIFEIPCSDEMLS